MPRHKIKFIYFDLGNVLLLFDHAVAARQMAELAGVETKIVQSIVFDSPVQNQYETGLVSTDEFYDLFCRETKTAPDKAELLVAASDMFHLNYRIIPIVSQLASTGIPLGILSNTCEAHWLFMKNGRYKLLDQFFSANVLSYEVKSMKPDSVIYQRAVELAECSPSEIFFMDDRPENVDGALAAGFDAVQFTTVAKLVDDLTERGIGLNY